MSSLTLLGDTSGSVVLDAPAVAGSSTITLPTTGGTIRTTTTPGTILQVVTSSLTPNITTTSQMPIQSDPTVSQGAQLVSVSFTPISATSNIVIQCIGANVRPSGTSNIIIALFQNSTLLAANTPRSTTSEPECTMALLWAGSAGSTSARTYSIRIGPQNPVTLYINNGNAIAFYTVPVFGFTIFEVAA